MSLVQVQVLIVLDPRLSVHFHYPYLHNNIHLLLSTFRLRDISYVTFSTLESTGYITISIKISVSPLMPIVSVDKSSSY
jgi:hypothetical protein